MIPAILSTLAAIAAASVPPNQDVTPPPADTSRKICRMIVPTGTITGRRFCLTRQQWDDLNKRTEESAAAMLGRRGTGTCDIACDR